MMRDTPLQRPQVRLVCRLKGALRGEKHHEMKRRARNARCGRCRQIFGVFEVARRNTNKSDGEHSVSTYTRVVKVCAALVRSRTNRESRCSSSYGSHFEEARALASVDVELGASARADANVAGYMCTHRLYAYNALSWSA
jgi:hypothetical protein